MGASGTASGQRRLDDLHSIVRCGSDPDRSLEASVFQMTDWASPQVQRAIAYRQTFVNPEDLYGPVAPLEPGPSKHWSRGTVFIDTLGVTGVMAVYFGFLVWVCKYHGSEDGIPAGFDATAGVSSLQNVVLLWAIGVMAVFGMVSLIMLKKRKEVTGEPLHTKV
jgi:hypothetical protein